MKLTRISKIRVLISLVLAQAKFSLRMFTESPTNKVSIPFWIIRWTLSLFVSQQVLFFVNVPLISFILKCHPLRGCLFRFNFLYSNVFSHFNIRDNLSRVNFQYSTYISWSVDFLS